MVILHIHNSYPVFLDLFDNKSIVAGESDGVLSGAIPFQRVKPQRLESKKLVEFVGGYKIPQ